MSRPVKILQFGAGNFLRGFCDWMIDLLNEKTDFNGNVVVVQPIRKGKGIALPQHNRYTVKINDNERLITCIDSVVNPHDEYQRFLSLAENTDLEFIISNTTEAGIAFGDNDTFPAKATAFLHHRYKTNKKALTFLPCELIENNATTLKSVINQYIDAWNLPADFRHWVNSEIKFCNTLVDRIVTGDATTVTAEQYYLWLIEGNVHIPFADAGLNVRFVENLGPYRTRKVRILNGAHTTLVPVAYLKGFRTVRESVEDKWMGDFLLKAIHEEIIPTLDLPEEELVEFANDTIARFKNPYIRHELASIALNSISKYRVRVLPSVLKFIEVKKDLPKRLLFSLGALIKLYENPINDTPEVLEFFKGKPSVEEILGNERFWGQDLNKVPELTECISISLRILKDEKH